MENQINLRNNQGYIILLYICWLLISLFFTPHVFTKNTDIGYVYIAIFLFAAIATACHFMLSISIVGFWNLVYDKIKLKRNINTTIENNLTIETKSIHPLLKSKDNFEEKLRSSDSLGDWIKSDIWEKLTKTDTWQVFFSVDGMIKENLVEYYTPLNSTIKIGISKNIIVTTLFCFLKDNKLFDDNYYWKELMPIANKLFKVKSVKDRKKYEDKRISFPISNE